jgi:hypothetical protein
MENISPQHLGWVFEQLKLDPEHNIIKVMLGMSRE